MSGGNSCDQEIDSIFGDNDENDDDDCDCLEANDDADLNAGTSPGNLTMTALYLSCESMWKFFVQI